MTDEPERKRSENGTAGLGEERAESRVVRGVERAWEAEDGKSSACCLEELNAEREPEEELQHEIAIDGLSEERHRCSPMQGKTRVFVSPNARGQLRARIMVHPAEEPGAPVSWSALLGVTRLSGQLAPRAPAMERAEAETPRRLSESNQERSGGAGWRSVRVMTRPSGRGA
jgi:hypothetical protein